MPLMIGRINQERTLKGLARNLFRIQGRNSGEQLRLAQEALLLANPRLANPEGFSRGATIVVPPIAGLTPTDRVEGKDSGQESALFNQLEERLQGLVQTTAAESEAASKRAKQASKGLETAAIRKAILAAAPDLKQRLPEIRKNAKQRIAEIDQRSAAVQETLAKALKDLGSLKGKLG